MLKVKNGTESLLIFYQIYKQLLTNLYTAIKNVDRKDLISKLLIYYFSE